MSFVLRALETLPLTDMNTDVAVPGLNRENAYRLEITLPDDPVLDAFQGISGRFLERIDLLTDENRTLAALRDALLPKLMSGELRVREAEAQVAEAV